MPTEGDLELLRVENRTLRAELDVWKIAVSKQKDLEAENERLRFRLSEQTHQTQVTAQQIRLAVLDAIGRHGGLQGIDLGHPIEQIVGTLLEIYRCEAEELREKLDAALTRGDEWTEIAADMAVQSTEATHHDRHALSAELREWATGPMACNPQHTRICNTLLLAACELDALARFAERSSQKQMTMPEGEVDIGECCSPELSSLLDLEAEGANSSRFCGECERVYYDCQCGKDSQDAEAEGE